MLVIVIIGIMLSITLSISWSQTKMLRFKIARENFIANYNAFIIKAITTNSSDTELIFQQKDGLWQVPQDPISLGGAWWENIYFESMSQVYINNFYIHNGWSFPSYTLSFNPIEGKCVLKDVWGTEVTDTIIPLDMKYRDDIKICPICYELSLSTCKLRQTSCDPAPTNC